jgi:hypothetical protein
MMTTYKRFRPFPQAETFSARRQLRLRVRVRRPFFASLTAIRDSPDYAGGPWRPAACGVSGVAIKRNSTETFA